MHPIEVIPRMTTLAPIVLFVYNRPAHTQRTVEALQKNKLATESGLVVFSDADKSDAQAGRHLIATCVTK